MKITRKGFTLVELLIVVGIIGILAAMGVVGGTEANNIANANKIVEEFRIIGAAMNLFYADNRAAIEANKDFTESDIKTGIKAYMKNTDSVEVIANGSTATAGKYAIAIDTTTKQWWLSYKLPQAESKVHTFFRTRPLQNYSEARKKIQIQLRIQTQQRAHLLLSVTYTRQQEIPYTCESANLTRTSHQHTYNQTTQYIQESSRLLHRGLFFYHTLSHAHFHANNATL